MLYILGYLIIMACAVIPWKHKWILIMCLTSLHLAIGVCFMIDLRAFTFEGDYFKFFYAGLIDPVLVGISFIGWLFCNWEIMFGKVN